MKFLQATCLLYFMLWSVSAEDIPYSGLDSTRRDFTRQSLPGTEPWVDPAPNPVDPTEPRPSAPYPYPEPPVPLPMPISPDLNDVMQLIRQLQFDLSQLKARVHYLENRKESILLGADVKKAEFIECQNFIPKLRSAIQQFIKLKQEPTASDRQLTQKFFIELLELRILSSIPHFHLKMKGSLSSEIFCSR